MGTHAASTLQFSREEMKEILREHDLNGDGVISITELIKAFGCFGHLHPFYKAHYGMAFADTDGNGCITEDELDNVVDYAQRFLQKNC